MSVVVSVEEVGPCRKQLKVEIPALEVAAATDEVVREIGRRTRLPGFRKGKVPPAVVRRRFKEDIEREVVDRLLPRFWRQAETESALDPLAPPEVEEVGTPADGEALTFVASVEVRPDITLGDLDGFTLPDPAVEPADAEVDEALDSLRRRVADWIEVDRPAGRGDRVTAEIVEEHAAPPAAEGEPAGEPGEGAPETVTVEVGDPDLWEELSLALTGLAAGQEGRFTRRPTAEDAAPRRFRVRAEKVEERDLPPLDDALAAKLGDFPDLAALRDEVVRGLGAQKRDERRHQRRRAVLDQLRAAHPVELPRGVVQHELEHLMRDYADQLGRRGLDPARARVDWDALAEQVRPQAERRVHERLLLDALVEREGVAVSDPELDSALAVLARSEGTNVPALRRRLTDGDRLAGLRAQLVRDKALARLAGETAEEAARSAAAEITAPGEAGGSDPEPKGT